MLINCGKSIAMRQALGVILDHEKIPFQSYIGAGSVLVLVVEDEQDDHVRTVILQWEKAVSALASEVGR
jgi:hypothetical protein